MANRHQALTAIQYILVMLLLASVVGSCSRSQSSHNNWSDITIPTSASRPESIMRVSPSESETLPLETYLSEVENAVGFTDSLGAYNANVCVQLSSVELARQGENFADLESFLDRNSMYVDGQKVEVHSQVFIGYTDESGEGGTKFDFVEHPIICWRAPLNVGLHEAEFQFRQTSGDMQNYTWYFLLTDEE